MKIILLAAMDKELNLILDVMNGCTEVNVDGVKAFKGKIGNHDIVAAKCGIGKVNSALNTYRIIRAEHPQLIINSGVAGGAGNGMKIGDLLVADRVAYHDVWCGPSTEYGAADGMPLFLTPSAKVTEAAKDIQGVNFGLICSGDKFISKAEEVAEIRSNFPDAKAVDMESASIAQTATMNGIDFAIVRVVSDTPGEGENVSQYKDFWSNAPAKTFEAVKHIIEKI